MFTVRFGEPHLKLMTNLDYQLCVLHVHPVITMLVKLLTDQCPARGPALVIALETFILSLSITLAQARAKLKNNNKSPSFSDADTAGNCPTGPCSFQYLLIRKTSSLTN